MMTVSPHLYAVAAFLFFALMNSCVKALGHAVPVPLALTVRFLVGFWFFYPLVRRAGGFAVVLKTQQPFLQLMRTITGFAAVALSFYTLPLIPLSAANALGQTYPFFLMLIAGPFLGERTNPKQYLTLIFGFVGVLIIARPSGVTGTIPALMMLGSAISAAVSDLVVRKLARQDQSLTIVMWFFILSCSISLVWWLATARDVQLQGQQLLLLIMAGVCGGLAQLCLTHAFKMLPARIMGPYSYLGFFWATVSGLVFFGEVPTLWIVAGAALIMIGAQLNYILAKRRLP